MSLSMRAVVGALAITHRHSSQNSPGSLEKIVKNNKSAELPAGMYERYGGYFRRVGQANIVHLDVEDSKHPNVLVYVHGGEYRKPMTYMHWSIVDRLIKSTQSSAVVPQYLLAPQHTAAEAYTVLDHTFAVAQKMARESGGKIIIAGDCAGGGLALAYMMNRRDRGLMLADSMLLFSPWLDVTLANPEIDAIKDPLLNRASLIQAGTAWAGAWSAQDPRISPIYGSTTDLPRTWIFQGMRDVMYPDVRKFSNLAVGAGMPLTLTVAPAAFHVYVGNKLLPESRWAFREIGKLFSE